eukprot:8151963-Pyramimonas_sp.AAC.1
MGCNGCHAPGVTTLRKQHIQNARRPTIVLLLRSTISRSVVVRLGDFFRRDGGPDAFAQRPHAAHAALAQAAVTLRRLQCIPAVQLPQHLQERLTARHKEDGAEGAAVYARAAVTTATPQAGCDVPWRWAFGVVNGKTPLPVNQTIEPGKKPFPFGNIYAGGCNSNRL